MLEYAKALHHIYSLNEQDVKNYTFTYLDILECLLLTGSIKESAALLDCTDSLLENVISRKLKTYFPDKSPNSPWDNYLLLTLDLRKCPKCLIIKSAEDYYNSNTTYNGLSILCISCEAKKSASDRKSNPKVKREASRNHYVNNKEYYLHRNALRRANKFKATPAWADINKIKEIYENCPKGMHVDHYYPLNSDWVCGLHTENNLQYLTPEQNKSKSNKRFDFH